jgi:hypothetical protein
MAEAKPVSVHVDVKFDTKYPKPPSTQQERIDALREAKSLVIGRDASVAGTLFGNATGAIRQNDEGVLTLLRLAEYITTGHDYLDTHPVPLEPTKKERRKRIKEIRKVVQEEMAAQVEANRGTLIMPKMESFDD